MSVSACVFVCACLCALVEETAMKSDISAEGRHALFEAMSCFIALERGMVTLVKVSAKRVGCAGRESALWTKMGDQLR